MERPYERIAVRTPQDVLDMTRWLQVAGADDPIGLAFRQRPRRLALASIDKVYVLSDDPLALSPLQALLTSTEPPRFVTRAAAPTLIGLHDWFCPTPDRETFDRLRRLLVGDLIAAGDVSGQPVLPAKRFKDIADDAYDVRLLEPQYQFQSPRYYYAVALPFVGLCAEAEVFGDRRPATWVISYPQLWLRVIAHYSGDPTLRWALVEQRDAIETISKLLESPPEQTTALLIWQALNRSTAHTVEHFPRIADLLPDDLPRWAATLDRKLPALCLSSITLSAAYERDRIARTLYGRQLRAGLHPAEACYHTIFGTVRDLVRVAAVTLWKNRPDRDMMVGRADDKPLVQANRLFGCWLGEHTVDEQEQWLVFAKVLAGLADPLSVPLAPAAVVVGN